jgi:flagellar hook protein FlgE
MFAAISGLQVHQTMLDVAANDDANVNTVGFKGEVTTFKDALSQLQRGAAGPSTGLGGTNAIQVGLGVQLGAIGNDMGAGATQQTGNPLDLAIQGDGFFRVGPQSVIGSGGGYSYTRAGNFGLDSAGNVSYVDAAGVVQKLAQISMAKFPNGAGLERISGNLYAQSNNSGSPANAVPGDATTGMGTLQAGAVEMSNVDLAKEFTTMITAQRGYEANSRVISMADEILQNLVNIGR